MARPARTITVVEQTPEVIEAPSNVITNCIKGTTLHLGDGRRLAFGESAEVAPAVAEALRESGQAE